ncbi:hypothetical protein EK0264_00135 [Epidermidibacterium keratini]|uniref:Cell wall protein n=1 Tax=Epidermidibacterium keratini TaxID=1891644 RepID=A0A7L4YJY8_9ACTN|nr:lamin tail domain-containing protein [Epidermidibacterium keratini]QHB98866.1 hypothetical protein EK0264_00135 [Epidermidibacterium keratini]
MSRLASALSGSIAILLAAAALVLFPGSAYAAPTDVQINEIESSGGVPGDWVELYNSGTEPVSLAGWGIVDIDPTHTATPLPADAVIEPGGFYVVEESVLGFGLGSGDSVTLTDNTGAQIDSYAWTAHAISSWARCPDGSGTFADSTTVTKGAANDCSSPVVLNEVESSGGEPGDWIELVNPSAATADISGFVVSDNDDTHTYVIPEGTTIPAGGYFVIDESALGFGLGGSDSARLFAPGGTLLDSYVWTSHATTTYGRCPDSTGDFATTTEPTKGATNTCPGDLAISPWPGSQDITAADQPELTAGDLSGLDYGTDSLWAVENGTGRLLKLTWDGTTLVPADGWAAGATLHYPDGTGTPDSEGVTVVGDGSIAVGTERNNDNGGVSRLSVLRFEPGASAQTLSATMEWELTSVLPVVGANSGIEAVEWIADSALGNLIDDTTGTTYDPADYPLGGGGLYFVGVEGTGLVHAFALNSDGTFALVSTLEPGLAGVMALDYDAATGLLWAVCDDNCEGTAAVFDLTSDQYAVPAYIARPTGMPNLNNEGFAIAPTSLCTAGSRPVWWTDDGDTDGYSVRVGSLPCADVPPTEPPTTTPPTTPPVTEPPTTAPTTGPTATQPPTTWQPSQPGTTAPAGHGGSAGGTTGGSLARTGADVGSGGVLAVGLLVTGGLLALAGRRRR